MPHLIIHDGETQPEQPEQPSVADYTATLKARIIDLEQKLAHAIATLQVVAGAGEIAPELK